MTELVELLKKEEIEREQARKQEQGRLIRVRLNILHIHTLNVQPPGMLSLEHHILSNRKYTS
jgi:hypothetical protein